jgi:hypothetical protein
MVREEGEDQLRKGAFVDAGSLDKHSRPKSLQLAKKVREVGATRVAFLPFRFRYRFGDRFENKVGVFGIGPSGFEEFSGLGQEADDLFILALAKLPRYPRRPVELFELVFPFFHPLISVFGGRKSNSTGKQREATQ